MTSDFLGSILVGKTRAEADILKKRIEQLSVAGLKAEYLCSSDLFNKEPSLLVDEDSGAAFVPDDCQLDAHRTVAYIEKVTFIISFILRMSISYFQVILIVCSFQHSSNWLPFTSWHILDHKVIWPIVCNLIL